MKEQLKEIEIPFGAKDSELKGWEYTIPEGMEAEIKGDRVIFREKESEDEKIRKAIYNCVKWFGFDSCFFKDVSQEKCLAWLEKQGEQKPATKLELDEHGEPILTPFEAELYSMMSDAWQGYASGEEVNIAKIVKEHSAELKEKANEYITEYVSGYSASISSDIEQKPVSNPKVGELTWEDIVYLEDLMANVHYEYRCGISQEGFGIRSPRGYV